MLDASLSLFTPCVNHLLCTLRFGVRCDVLPEAVSADREHTRDHIAQHAVSRMVKTVLIFLDEDTVNAVEVIDIASHYWFFDFDRSRCNQTIVETNGYPIVLQLTVEASLEPL